MRAALSKLLGASALPLCLFFAALAIRWWGLPAQSGAMYGDEAQFMIVARGYIHGVYPSPFISDERALSSLYEYMLSFPLRFAGMNVTVARAFTGFIGALSIPLLYGIARELGYPKRVGVVASIVLAGSFWHVLYSRLAIQNVTASTATCLSLLFLVMAVRRSNVFFAGMAGVGLAGAFNAYLSGPMVAPIVFGWLGLLIVVHGRRRKRVIDWSPGSRTHRISHSLRMSNRSERCPLFKRRSATPYNLNDPDHGLGAGGLLAIGLTVLVVAVACSWPILMLYIQKDSPFIAHATDRYMLSSANRADFASLHPHLGSKTISILWYQLKATVGIFLIQGDPDPQFNIPGRPMLDPLSGILFFLGIASLLRFIRRPNAALCLMWLLIPFTLGMLLTTGTIDVEMAPASTRVQPAIPALCLIIAIGLETALSPLALIARIGGWARWGPWSPRTIRAILAGMIALTICVWEVQRYVAFVRSPDYRNAYYTAAHEWSQFIGAQGSVPVTLVGPNAWPVEFPLLYAPNAQICAGLWSLPHWSRCPPTRIVIFDTDPNDAHRYGKATGLAVHDGPSDDDTIRFWYVEGRRLPDPASVLGGKTKGAG